MDDYYKTALRMWESANLLIANANGSQGKIFNSCYLTGYVLECYGKLILGRKDKSGVAYGHNLSRIKTDLIALIPTNNSYAKYALDLSSKCSTITGGIHRWHPDNRYSHRTDIWNTLVVANKYLYESKEVMDILIKMEIDGVI